MNSLQITIRNCIIEAMELDQDDLPDTLDVDEVETWDSLSHLQLITLLESHLNISIPNDVVPTLLSEEEILKTVSDMV